MFLLVIPISSISFFSFPFFILFKFPNNNTTTSHSFIIPSTMCRLQSSSSIFHISPFTSVTLVTFTTSHCPYTCTSAYTLSREQDNRGKLPEISLVLVCETDTETDRHPFRKEGSVAGETDGLTGQRGVGGETQSETRNTHKHKEKSTTTCDKTRRTSLPRMCMVNLVLLSAHKE